MRPAFGFLLLALREGPVSLRELVATLGTSKQAVSKLVDAMVGGRAGRAGRRSARRPGQGPPAHRPRPGAARRRRGDLRRAGGRVGPRPRRGRGRAICAASSRRWSGPPTAGRCRRCARRSEAARDYAGRRAGAHGARRRLRRPVRPADRPPGARGAGLLRDRARRHVPVAEIARAQARRGDPLRRPVQRVRRRRAAHRPGAVRRRACRCSASATASRRWRRRSAATVAPDRHARVRPHRADASTARRAARTACPRGTRSG